MSLDIKIGDRIAKVKFLEMTENTIRIQVDDNTYEVDIVPVGDMIYSLLYEGRSYNIEMIRGNLPNSYHVNAGYNSYDVEIRDASSRLKLGKGKDDFAGDGNSVICPMAAKIVKVLVSPGDKVVKNQTLAVVSAMKMEIDFKALKDATVKKVHVKEEDTVQVNTVLIELE